MPVNIIRFERLAYLSLAISVVATILDNQTTTGLHLGPLGLGIVIVLLVAVGGALISATARLRKNWLRWLYTGLYVLGFIGDMVWMIPSTIAEGNRALLALTVGEDVLAVACIALLFSASANAWFRTSVVAQPAT